MRVRDNYVRSCKCCKIYVYCVVSFGGTEVLISISFSSVRSPRQGSYCSFSNWTSYTEMIKKQMRHVLIIYSKFV